MRENKLSSSTHFNNNHNSLQQTLKDLRDLPTCRFVSREGLEPPTNTLRGYCSTIELTAQT